MDILNIGSEKVVLIDSLVYELKKLQNKSLKDGQFKGSNDYDKGTVEQAEILIKGLNNLIKYLS